MVCADYSVGSCSWAGGSVPHLDLPLAELLRGQSHLSLALACSQLFLSVLCLVPLILLQFRSLCPPDQGVPPRPGFVKIHSPWLVTTPTATRCFGRGDMSREWQNALPQCTQRSMKSAGT